MAERSEAKMRSVASCQKIKYSYAKLRFALKTSLISAIFQRNSTNWSFPKQELLYGILYFYIVFPRLYLPVISPALGDSVGAAAG